MIKYDIRTGVKKIKTKTFLAISGASIAAVGLFMAVAMPFAAKAATPTWDLTGQYNIAFTCVTGCSGTYNHDATISGENNSGDFSIAGGYPAGGPHTVGWSGTGNTTGNAVTTNTDYNLGAVGHLTMTGAVAVNGSMSGNWSDNYDGTATPPATTTRTGTWVATTGSAQPNTSSTVVVTGNTSAGENQPGWLFNRDVTTSTPYEFNTDHHSIGKGSLYVKPIGANPSDKFIAENFIGTPVANLNSISYDYMQAGTTSPTSYKQFYMNVYANFGESSPTKFYDCRYDYVPASGNQTGWNTATFATNSTPTLVTQRGDSPHTCPALLSDMTGGFVRMFDISVGDTSASDTGLAGYLDNVVVTKSTLSKATYDFDPALVTVTIAKNLNDSPATAASANNTTFPMESTWSTTNIGSGTGTYGLGPVGFNNPNPYQATTSDMNVGASYTTHEITGATVATSCTVGGAPYVLKGYTTGDTLSAAEQGTPTTTVPSFTNLQADKFVVVWNNTCTTPTTKDDCRNNGWKTFNNPSFKNKDKCIDFVVKNGHKVKGDVNYTAYNLKREAEFEMNTYDHNKGEFEYWDNSHGHYKVKVSVVKVNGHDAWFAGVVTKASNPSWVGQWLFAKVHDNSPDQVSGSFTDQTTATTGVNAMANPTDGPFNVTSGNLKVN